MPEGFKMPGKVLLLLKALYGLKQAPQLWYNHLTKTLKRLGLQEVPGVNCVLSNESIILFYYVDSTILWFFIGQRTSLRPSAYSINSKEQYDLRVIPEANWFLGIRIVRDRATRRL